MNANETTEKVVDEIDRAIPCPFCGEELYLTVYRSGSGFFNVTCDECGGVGGPGKTKADAVDKWNKRPEN